MGPRARGPGPPIHWPNGLGPLGPRARAPGREMDLSRYCCIASRIGLGKVRHLDTALPWLQHHVNKQHISMMKVAGGSNVAGLGTKDLDAQKMCLCMTGMWFVELSGRHPKALAVNKGLSQASGQEEGVGEVGAMQVQVARVAPPPVLQDSRTLVAGSPAASVAGAFRSKCPSLYQPSALETNRCVCV
eukprot:4764000-Amphidinium_carterae.1